MCCVRMLENRLWRSDWYFGQANDICKTIKGSLQSSKRGASSPRSRWPRVRCVPNPQLTEDNLADALPVPRTFPLLQKRLHRVKLIIYLLIPFPLPFQGHEVPNFPACNAHGTSQPGLWAFLFPNGQDGQRPHCQESQRGRGPQKKPLFLYDWH